MKQLPTPLRLLLMLCICLLAFSPAAYAACPHSTCPDGSCNIDSSYDDEGGYVGKPVGDRPVHFDTINICGDELCWDGNCGDTPTEDDDAPAPCPYDCSRCDKEKTTFFSVQFDEAKKIVTISGQIPDGLTLYAAAYEDT
ncbi:MAG: hypothetical protein IJC70_00680, partial [Firmicutes bacterium]|nr:hypothetical protein [Bacillota bacterium]